MKYKTEKMGCRTALILFEDFSTWIQSLDVLYQLFRPESEPTLTLEPIMYLVRLTMFISCLIGWQIRACTRRSRCSCSWYRGHHGCARCVLGHCKIRSFGIWHSVRGQWFTGRTSSTSSQRSQRSQQFYSAMRLRKHKLSFLQFDNEHRTYGSNCLTIKRSKK